MQTAVSSIKMDKHDPHAAEGHPDRKDITVASESEPILLEGVRAVSEQSADINARWLAREKRDGKKYWVCPLCDKSAARQEFKTAKACQAHISKAHKMKVQELKLIKAPKEAYSPAEKIHSPKLTLADVLPAGAADYARAARESHEQMQQSLRQAKKGNGSQLSAVALISTTEMVACGKVSQLSNPELKDLAQMAWSRGKKRLTKVTRLECQKRNIALTF